MTPRPLVALALIVILSAPIYVWGIFYPIEGLPFGLPGTAVMIVVPAIVASFLTLRESGGAAVAALWRGVFDFDRIGSPRWTAQALLSMPAATVAAYVVMQAAGLPLPLHPTFNVAVALVACVAYFAAAALEEVAWTGYCTAPLQERFGIVGASIIIGSVWAAWHFIPWIVIQGHAAIWVAGQTAITILMRILMGYIYAHGGQSLFLATLCHATINVSFSAFPNNGSHYDPVVVALVLTAGMLMTAGLTRSHR